MSESQGHRCARTTKMRLKRIALKHYATHRLDRYLSTIASSGRLTKCHVIEQSIYIYVYKSFGKYFLQSTLILSFGSKNWIH